MASSASRALCVLICALAICQGASAVTPSEVQDAFGGITTLSGNLRDRAASLNVLNALFKGPLIAQGFYEIISAVAKYTARMTAPGANAGPFSDVDAKLVVQSLTTFVRVHQDLLNVVIGKHGLLSLFLFAEPVRVSLVTLEGTVDAFAFSLIAMIPTQAPAANEQFGKLSITVQGAITIYS